MRIFWLETKKLISSPAVWGFVVVCVAFNALLVANNSHAAREDADGPNVFEGYQTAPIACAYIDALGVGGSIAENMRWKYAALQPVVEQKARDGDALGLYTNDQHRGIFNGILKPLLYEWMIIAALAMLLALGCEHINRTEYTVYASKTGRRLIWHKLTAAVAAAFGVCAVVAVAALLPVHALYGDLWGCNVSSAYNYFYDHIAGARPFATWRSFTVLGYLWAAIGTSAVVVLCCALAAFVAGASIRDSFAAFIALLLFSMCCLSFPFMAPNDSYIIYIFAYTPVWLATKLPIWFTDGGADILWPRFETWGAAISLAAMTLVALLAAHRFKRRDIA
jgi:hypothetical protein